MKAALRKKLADKAKRKQREDKESARRSPRKAVRELRDATVKYRPRKDVVKNQPKAEEHTLAVKEQALTPVDARMLVYASRVNKIDKDIGLAVSLNKQPRMSTGLLTFDLLLGNGFVPGFNVVFGAEASAKSTASMTALGSSLRTPIPVRKYFDAEGAVDRRYTGNILKTDSFDDVFGSFDRKGNWIKPPLCRYHDTNIIEEVFKDIHRVASFMPDKKFRPEFGDNGEWFLVFERTRDQVQLMKDLKLNPDKGLYQKTGKYWCSIGDDDAPQGVFFIDSLPALIPQGIDEETMSDKAMAIEARFMSKYMKLVRGSLRPKGLILHAVNQLRANPSPSPGAMPWYEPMGNAVKFASDTRTMWTTRVPMDGFPRFKDNGGLCEEPSIEYPGGTDLYAFKGMTNIKNKYGTPGRKTSARVWIKDGNGAPRGFDPVYDTYKFLDEIGVLPNFVPSIVTDKRKTFRIDLKPVRDVEFTWPMFKAMILAEDTKRKPVVAKARELGAPRFGLREYCFKLIRTGRSEELMTLAARKQREKPVEVDLEADDSDE